MHTFTSAIRRSHGELYIAEQIVVKNELTSLPQGRLATFPRQQTWIVWFNIPYKRMENDLKVEDRCRDHCSLDS